MPNSVSLSKKDFKLIMKRRLYNDWVNILILNIESEDNLELYEKLYLKNIGDFLTPDNVKISCEEAEENYYNLLKEYSKSNKLYKDYLKIVKFYKDKTYKNKDIKYIVISIELYNFLKSDKLFGIDYGNFNIKI